MGLGVQAFLPTQAAPLVSWMVYVANEPGVPDDCLTVYDTTGNIDAKTQPDGEVCQHEGIQVRVRSVDHPTGWAKANAIAVALTEDVDMMVVTVGPNRYLLQAVNQVGQVTALGREGSDSRRRVFTINFTVAVRQLPYGNIH